MKQKIKYKTSVAQRLSTYSLMSQLVPFQGEKGQTLNGIVAKHIEEQAHAKGYETAMDDINEFVGKKIDNYISVVTKQWMLLIFILEISLRKRI